MSLRRLVNAIHDDLLKICDEIDTAKILFRNPSAPTRKLPSSFGSRVVVDRDRAMCALLVKAIYTSKAVRLLGENGFSGDAFALTRVLLENAVIMAWLIHGPATVRLDTFCLAGAPRKNRWLEILETYYAEEPDLAVKVDMIRNANADEIARQLFDDRHTTWAIFENDKGKLAAATVKDMFLGAGQVPTTSSFAYDAPYFDASSFVHSGPESTRRLAAQLTPSRFFSVQISPTDDELSERAMSLANTSLALALAAFAEYTGVTDIAVALDPILTAIRDVSQSKKAHKSALVPMTPARTV